MSGTLYRLCTVQTKTWVENNSTLICFFRKLQQEMLCLLVFSLRDRSFACHLEHIGSAAHSRTE